MSKKLDTINLAAEFGNHDLDIFLSATDWTGALSLDRGSQELVHLTYIKGHETNLKIWDWAGPYEAWNNHTFEDTLEGWTNAKIAFRAAVLEEVARA